MKPLEIKGARTRLGLTQQEVADKLEISIHTYQKKESGVIKFTEDEKPMLGEILGLSFEQLDSFLYDGKLSKFLPNSNTSIREASRLV